MSALQVAGFGLSHLDKMALAVRDILAASPQLVAWTGGRISRQDLFAPDLSTVAPFIIVGTLTEAAEQQVGCVEKTVQIGVILGWEIFLSQLDDEAPTVSTVIDEVHRLLMENQALTVTAFGGQPLARQLTGFQQIDYGGGTTESNTVKMVLVDSARYRVHFSSEWRPA